MRPWLHGHATYHRRIHTEPGHSRASKATMVVSHPHDASVGTIAQTRGHWVESDRLVRRDRGQGGVEGRKSLGSDSANVVVTHARYHQDA